MKQEFDIDPNLINELAKSIKSEKDLAALSKHLLKLTVERAMNVEMDERLGYEKHSVALEKIVVTAAMAHHLK